MRPGPRTRPGWPSRRPARASGCARRRDRGPIRRPWRRPRRRGCPGDRRSRCGHTRGPAEGGSRSPSTIPDGGTSAGPRSCGRWVRPSMWTGCTSTPFRRSSSETRATLALPARRLPGWASEITVERYEPGLTESSKRRRRASEGGRGDFLQEGCLVPSGMSLK